MKKIDVKIGDKYGILTIIEEVFLKKRRSFRCRCECGNEKTIIFYNLRNGHTESCGCIRIETSIKCNTTHGLSYEKIYAVWRGILSRCYRINDTHYKYYGGRGIRCEWKNFEEFYSDMGKGYMKGLSIERMDNNGNYCRENCTWIPLSEQSKNRRYVKNRIKEENK